MKIPSRYEVITIYSNQEDARKAEGTKKPKSKQVNLIEEEAESSRRNL